MTFKQWRLLDQFNNICVKSADDAKYIILIPHSLKFNLEEDLQMLFKRKFKMFQFKKIFEKMQCHLMYFTVFSNTQKREYGPIAEDTSVSICSIILKEKIKNHRVQIVGPIYLKNKFNIITIDQFRLIITC